MRPGDHAREEPSGTNGSAGQSPAQAAVTPVAPAQAAPDGDAGKAGQRAGAVWDQPLPWVSPRDGDQEQNSGQQTSSQAEPPAAPASPTPQPAAAGEEGGDDAEAAAGKESADDLWQAAVSGQRRETHATPAPSRAVAVSGHAVSKWLLGVAVAVGGLLAAVGVVEGLSSHPSASTAKEEAEPILGPGKGLGPAGTPTASPKSHPASPTGKPAVTARFVGVAAGHPGSGSAPGTAHKAPVLPTGPTVKSSVAAQSGYLSARSSVTSPNEYWSQSNVTVTTTKKLTALKVVVRISQAGGVASTGTWTSLGDKVTVHSAAGNDGVDYVVTLNSGVTVNPGTYVFEFQYNHNKGTRDTSHDVYTVVATASGSDGTETRQGRF